MKRSIIQELTNIDDSDEELKKVIYYLKKHPLLKSQFPYGFTNKYKKMKINVYREDDYPYVIYQKKKMYGPKEWSNKEYEQYYRSLLLEQDIHSPHRYLYEERNPDINDVIADVGAAEGIFSLEIIENVEHVYLFEGDEKWIEPLRKTFEPYKKKTDIVMKYVGNISDEKFVKMDDFFEKRKITYIKADIEGAEEQMLRGASAILGSKVKRILLCAYHNNEDEKMEKYVLNKYGFEIKTNPGYMLRISDDKDHFIYPYIRRGVIYGCKA